MLRGSKMLSYPYSFLELSYGFHTVKCGILTETDVYSSITYSSLNVETTQMSVSRGGLFVLWRIFGHEGNEDLTGCCIDEPENILQSERKRPQRTTQDCRIQCFLK